MGQNGAGKSTIFKLITGDLQPLHERRVRHGAAVGRHPLAVEELLQEPELVVAGPAAESARLSDAQLRLAHEVELAEAQRLGRALDGLDHALGSAGEDAAREPLSVRHACAAGCGLTVWHNAGGAAGRDHADGGAVVLLCDAAQRHLGVDGEGGADGQLLRRDGESELPGRVSGVGAEAVHVQDQELVGVELVPTRRVNALAREAPERVLDCANATHFSAGGGDSAMARQPVLVLGRLSEAEEPAVGLGHAEASVSSKVPEVPAADGGGDGHAPKIATAGSGADALSHL